MPIFGLLCHMYETFVTFYGLYQESMSVASCRYAICTLLCSTNDVGEYNIRMCIFENLTFLSVCTFGLTFTIPVQNFLDQYSKRNNRIFFIISLNHVCMNGFDTHLKK